MASGGGVEELGHISQHASVNCRDVKIETLANQIRSSVERKCHVDISGNMASKTYKPVDSLRPANVKMCSLILNPDTQVVVSTAKFLELPNS